MGTSCIKYCSAPDLPVLAVTFFTFTTFFQQGTCKFQDISGGNGPKPHPPIQQVPDMLNEIEFRALHFSMAENDAQNEQYGWWHCHVGGSCQDEPARRVPHEGGGCLSCNARHTAPDHDGPSTSKSIPLLSTGLCLMLIPLMINASLTITPGETKLQLISEEHVLPVLSCPAMVDLCP